eukprot:gene35837-44191_t
MSTTTLGNVIRTLSQRVGLSTTEGQFVGQSVNVCSHQSDGTVQNNVFTAECEKELTSVLRGVDMLHSAIEGFGLKKSMTHKHDGNLQTHKENLKTSLPTW